MPCGATRSRRSGRSSPVAVDAGEGHGLTPPSRGIIDATDKRRARGAGGSRTRFRGFANRRAVLVKPLKNRANSSHRNSLAPSLLHDNCQDDPELAALVAAWPKLPQTIRAGIMAMIGVASK